MKPTTMPEPEALPAISTAPLSVVLWAHNAQDHVDRVVENWTTHLDRLDRDYQLLLIDDGSTDRTEALVQGLQSRLPKLKCVRHAARRGVGAALRTGMAAARHSLLVYAPCDRRYQPGELKMLLAEIDKVHLVSGYRRGRPVPRGWKWLGRLWRGLVRIAFTIDLEPLPGWLGWRGHAHALLLRIFFGVRLRDPGCEFRLFRRSLFARIPIQSEGPFVHDEIVAKANFLGAVMTEVCVSYQPAATATEARGHYMADARRVFSHPDFGPVNVAAAHEA